ncbi:1-(5-phosphoribosyl)-5-[(5-phosphoribosylamino)methylideneamino]imidazole-4-carboxamide isomerase [Lysobacter pythonis]|uniref:1-(5-phosphoribosyl)-5-[(5-phosphoribosylamino)methylideneamino] imidazole-4-carboxamide isomerase n=1 Tax=Solilutibacter pythonis TaxID=2483112 RepID=A0A3M2HX28_9GAMM|nr:1-(5-phosphoribosyl)-5-[(5-phosphoribosylamino)methylideneamino]imidazole-4-carboxamide isomerase [Lysobacter pythonis]RMH90757.1 1-(5-phosphoribosyl)-5-[(5-phosphoribosylamino)methylideneamino]imidazole-4-carboxamide isomerase [Lysobacter pythonis]
MSFILYPAIDVRAGRVVRLKQGDYARETRYGDAPADVARRYAEAGAAWLHLVDLDAAYAGGYTLYELLRAIVGETDLQVQTGGGVRGEADVERMLEAGAARVVVGSLAVREPRRVLGWLHRFGAERIAIALDTRQGDDGEWRLPSHGWTEDSPHQLHELAASYADAGLRHLLCTDIARDGMLAGPNIDLYRHLRAALPSLRIQASGGIRDIGDIRAARDAGCAGAVLGKALLEGRFTLAEALRC